MNNDRPTVNRINTVPIVYRVDTRDLETITDAGGFFPRTPGARGQLMHNLTYHFQGSAFNFPDNPNVSAFISTTSSVTTAFSHGYQLLDLSEYLDDYDEDSEIYIYEIRPNNNFYHLEGSFQIARDEAQAAGDTVRVDSIDSATDSYLGMDEYVAHEGIRTDRIIRYTRVTEDTIKTHGLEILQNEEFWREDCIWHPNDDYNRNYGNDTSSPTPYRNIANPTGTIRGLTNSTIPEDPENPRGNFTRLSEVCADLRPSTSHQRSSREVKTTWPCKIPKRMKIKTVFNGSEYCIRSSINQSAVVDLSENKSGANVHIYEDLNRPNQKWKLSYDYKKRAYKIVSSQNESLALTWNSKHDDNVMGYEFQNYTDQFWIIEETGDGFYILRSYDDPSIVLDLKYSSTKNKNNIGVYVQNNTKAQKWKITSKKLNILPDGEYQIRSSINSNVLVDLSENRSRANVWAYGNLFRSNQKWKFSYNYEKRAYKIVSSQNESLALTWNSKHDDNVMGYEFQNYTDQFWIIEETGDGFYILRSYHDPSIVLDLANASIDNKNNIRVYVDNNTKAQKWSIERVGKPILLDGIYTISTRLNYKKVLDYKPLPNGSLMIFKYVNLVSSDFKIEYNPEKQAYKIYTTEYDNYGILFQSKQGPLKIDNIDNDSIGLRKYWFIEYEPNNGGYIIRSAYDPTQVIDLRGSNLEDGTEILASGINLGKNQIWNFMPKKLNN